jgi:hypothetical protein
MVAGGGEVMGEGVTAELVIGRTEKKLFDVNVEDRSRLVELREFFSRVLTWRFCQFHRLLFWSSQTPRPWIPQGWLFCSTAETVDCRIGVVQKKTRKKIPLEQVLSMLSGCWVRSKSYVLWVIT